MNEKAQEPQKTPTGSKIFGLVLLTGLAAMCVAAALKGEHKPSIAQIAAYEKTEEVRKYIENRNRIQSKHIEDRNRVQNCLNQMRRTLDFERTDALRDQITGSTMAELKASGRILYEGYPTEGEYDLADRGCCRPLDVGQKACRAGMNVSRKAWNAERLRVLGYNR